MAFRSAVCSGGSIRFSMGVTGWTRVRSCEGVVPFAVESAGFDDAFQMSSKRARAKASKRSM